MSLDRSKFDKISQLLADSVNTALDALSPILGAEITAQTQPAAVHTIKDTDYSAVTPALYFNIVFVGDISGKAVAVFREIDLAVILRLLMDSDSDEIEFDEMSLGMIKEIMSQVSAKLSGSVGEFFGVDANASISALMQFEGNNVVANAFGGKELNECATVNVKYEVGTILKGKAAFSFDEMLVSNLTKYYEMAGGNDEAQQQMTASSNMQSAAPVNKQNVRQQSQQRPAGNTNSPALNISPSSFPRFDTGADDGMSGMPGNMDLLMEVPMNVCIEIGKTKKKMKEIMNFSQGTIIPIDKQAGAPVDITVNGQLIARGDVIVIDDNFGVRITELVGSAKNGMG
ncbi:MAG: flagellar motor switch protein FliN [Ruminococcus sp.]|nr:flagellar motor switch protein FliN [Ruminococcus sp.]